MESDDENFEKEISLNPWQSQARTAAILRIYTVSAYPAISHFWHAALPTELFWHYLLPTIQSDPI